MVRVHTIDITPPLINSSCAWASDFSQLRELYDCPHTGAVTTRTATLKGFSEDGRHQVRQCVYLCLSDYITHHPGCVLVGIVIYAELVRLFSAPPRCLPGVGVHSPDFTNTCWGFAVQAGSSQHHILGRG